MSASNNIDTDKALLYEVSGRVATLTLNRPDRLNAITSDMMRQFRILFERAQSDASVHTIRLRGAGKSFCAGYDIRFGAEEMQKLERDGAWDPVQDYELMSGYVETFMRLWRSPKPVIAQIQGYCVGGGTDFALCSDLIVCAEDSKIGYPPARVWGVPTTAMWVYRIGLERAKRLLLTGDAVDGRTAVSWGLASEAVPATQLDQAGFQLAQRVSLLPQSQLHMMKLLVNQTYEQMGIGVSQLIGTLFDGIARHTPEGVAFTKQAVHDLRQAIADRDTPFADYGQSIEDQEE
jgi:enoyl-CoA hydratase